MSYRSNSIVEGLGLNAQDLHSFKVWEFGSCGLEVWGFKDPGLQASGSVRDIFSKRRLINTPI